MSGFENKSSYLRSASRLCVAPMMDWTDRHCRYFHRLLTSETLLYTEMVVADAVIHGQRDRLLRFDEAEQPLAVQLGGSDPQKLAEASKICADWGYGEINLNVGCPSDRVQSGTFGACLMLEPELVSQCVAAMKQSVSDDVAITVKCRIGVDEQDPKEALFGLAEQVWRAGCDNLWVHARKAWLKGLSPKENREIPPLDYELVYALKRENADKFIGINGGIAALSDIEQHLTQMDGVMVGRAAYHTPDILRGFDALLGQGAPEEFWSKSEEVIEKMIQYAAKHIHSGGRLHHVSRHMVGLFHGLSGARLWRRTLSEQAAEKTAEPDVLMDAFEAVRAQNC